MEERLAEIEKKHKDFIYPSSSEFGIHEEDVEFLINNLKALKERNDYLEHMRRYINDKVQTKL